jgi:hypothetical protein
MEETMQKKTSGRGYGGPYAATYTGGKRYEAKPGKPECLWLMFDLDDGRRLPFKGYFGKGERKDKAIREAVEALGFMGDANTFDPDLWPTGHRVRVKCWKQNDGVEFESATYVNRFEGATNETLVPPKGKSPSTATENEIDI